MSDKATLMRAGTDTFTELEQAIEGLGDESMSRVWLGTWGVREILVHISGWHREMIPALERIASGATAPYAAGTYDDFDGWNARFVAARAGVKAGDVLDELRASHRDFMAAARAVPTSTSAPAAPCATCSTTAGPATTASTRRRSATGARPGDSGA